MNETPLLSEMMEDKLNEKAKKNWLKKTKYDSKLIENIYKEDLFGSNFDSKKITLLEYTHYFENYLWLNFNDKSSYSHVMSIILMINEKKRQQDGILNWLEIFERNDILFSTFFKKYLNLYGEINSMKEKEEYLSFLIICFQSFEIEMIRNECFNLIGPQILIHIGENRRNFEFENDKKLKKIYEKRIKKSTKLESNFIFNLLNDDLITFIKKENLKEEELKICDLILELLIDLLSQLPTRKFIQILLDDLRILCYCKFYFLNSKYLNLFEYYLNFEMTTKELENRILNLQKICFKFHQKNLKELSIRNISSLKIRYNLKKWFSILDLNELIELSDRLNITIRNKEDEEFLIEILISNFEEIKKENFEQVILFPTEKDIFKKEKEILPKLNLQFLSFKDYLIRNFKLFKESSIFNLKLEIEEAILKMKPRRNIITNSTEFIGDYKYCVGLKDFRILDSNNNEFVEAYLNYSLLNLKKENRKEFEEIKQFDILMLLNIDILNQSNPLSNSIKLIRGCEVIHQEDLDGTKYIDSNFDSNKLFGSERKLKIKLDKIQYEKDNENGVDLGKFNLILKINSKENNFKSILETIKNLILNENELILPDWFNDLFLGYGNPQDSNFKNISNSLNELNLYDTILNVNHLNELYPKLSLNKSSLTPFKVYLNKESKEIERFESIKNDEFKMKNEIKYTKNQFESILSGMNLGLTLINGAPGTGKTDVAVQTILNLYKNNERNLIITHSNNGLNEIFKKIINSEMINPSHLLRLGHGEIELKEYSNFTKYGRMNYILQRRLNLLEEVSKLNSNYSQTCETCFYYFNKILLPNWLNFKLKCEKEKDINYLKLNFPFYQYFKNENEFKKEKKFEILFKKSNEYFLKIENLFKELEEYKSFEIIRSNQEREKFILTSISKIIGMTSTYSALKRNYFFNNHFEFDNLIIEESSQILEIESFISMILQLNSNKKLKRIIILGDENQLNPIIKYQHLKKYNNFNQSLFQRLIRLNVPFIQLNSQGRMRSELSNIWKVNYKSQILDLNQNNNQFKISNLGFKYNYQFFNLNENNDEIKLNQFYFQNLKEAEFIVSIYMYMRLIGYHKDNITILTTYNGQKDLIKDILKRRCDNIPFLKSCHVSTVDNYQGQQNDFILLSLVRTKSVGYLRDLKRFIVSLSRARLGLYIIGKRELFENCIELQPSLNQLFKHPTDYLYLENNKIKNLKEMGELNIKVIMNILK
eukprot:gene6060-10061_t